MKKLLLIGSICYAANIFALASPPASSDTTVCTRPLVPSDTEVVANPFITPPPAFATCITPGPPELKNTLYFGVGGDLKSVKTDAVINQSLIGTVTDPFFAQSLGQQEYTYSASRYSLAVTVQAGYDYFFPSGRFVGLKNMGTLINQRFTYNSRIPILFEEPSLPSSAISAIAQVQWMYSAMIEYGFLIRQFAFYIEGGYSALSLDLVLRNMTVGGFVIGEINKMVNGGVAGLGMRFYAGDNSFFDFQYLYTPLTNSDRLCSGSVRLGGLGTIEFPLVDLNACAQLKRVSIQDTFVFSYNYRLDFL